ncbi:saccharopine dehydrogenase family protein [Asticcacaulis taihuensis]|uniref:saccharopine dehydrogenase family protein n=1 Tax=Asticcacaulis taihuensis TaxID=260084 RepID=UPI0026F14A70|nr:saccharopine dehydrogenase NADP-binding domain-containing protein [Asticcacaulis taihuensis]
MPNEILILGGYGNFGKRITRALSRHGLPLIIAGRDLSKAEALCRELPNARPLRLDIHSGMADALSAERPSVVIHTSGPFQDSDYSVARACIAARVHYVDLADGRDFVVEFSQLDREARAAGVTLVSGASTVPGLSSAVIEHLKPAFARMKTLDFGISPGQKAERGLATTRGILSYVGKPLRPFAGHPKPYGWQDIRCQTYPVMGRRWLANCDIPDLDLLPAAYGFKSIRFGAGLELGVLHLGLWGLSWLVRAGLPLPLPAMAEPLLAASDAFNFLGSDIGGMHVTIGGIDHTGAPLTRSWFIVAKSGDGPEIPCVPAILLAKRLHEKDPTLAHGALPCVGLVRLDEYLSELQRFDIETFEI